MKKALIILIIINIALIMTTIFLSYSLYQAKAASNSAHESMRQAQKQIEDRTNMIKDLEREIAELKEPEENVVKDEDNKEENNTETKYEITKNLPEDFEFDEKTRGYEIVEKENKYYVIVKSGPKSSSGYGIGIEKVEIDGKKATIFAKETSPEPGETVLTVITYPYVAVIFDFKPEVNIEFN